LNVKFALQALRFYDWPVLQSAPLWERRPGFIFKGKKRLISIAQSLFSRSRNFDGLTSRCVPVPHPLPWKKLQSGEPGRLLSSGTGADTPPPSGVHRFEQRHSSD